MRILLDVRYNNIPNVPFTRNRFCHTKKLLSFVLTELKCQQRPIKDKQVHGIRQFCSMHFLLYWTFHLLLLLLLEHVCK